MRFPKTTKTQKMMLRALQLLKLLYIASCHSHITGGSCWTVAKSSSGAYTSLLSTALSVDQTRVWQVFEIKIVVCRYKTEYNYM